MTDNAGSVYINNGKAESSNYIQDIDAEKFKVVYEVIRIIEKVPLYFEDHYARLENSLRLLELSLELHQEELKAQIRCLVDANKLESCNVKLVLYHKDGRQNYMVYISKSYYPSIDEVNRGVHTSLMSWVRHDPNAKVVNRKYKEEVDLKIKEGKAFEVLLVNEDKKITEGSRSNAFFIKGSNVYTAPGNLVLKGITRQYILKACARVNVKVIESLIGVDMLNEIDGLFISGTSIKVLPVASVDSRKYDSSKNPVIISIKDEFDKMIKEYLHLNKQE